MARSAHNYLLHVLRYILLLLQPYSQQLTGPQILLQHYTRAVFSDIDTIVNVVPLTIIALYVGVSTVTHS